MTAHTDLDAREALGERLLDATTRWRPSASTWA
jgi:hypothetical protein